MGIHRENGGYSATIEAFLVVDGERFRVAKTNASDFTLADTCELAPGTAGNLLIIVDGYEDSSQVTLPDGVLAGQTVVNYTVTGPFQVCTRSPESRVGLKCRRGSSTVNS